MQKPTIDRLLFDGAVSRNIIPTTILYIILWFSFYFIVYTRCCTHNKVFLFFSLSSLVFRNVLPPPSVAKCPRTNVTVVSRTLPGYCSWTGSGGCGGRHVSQHVFVVESHHNSYLFEVIFLTVFLSRKTLCYLS